MAIQLRSATEEMAPRLQPMLSAIGLRNTPSENRDPIPMQTMSAEAPTTTQP